MPGQQRFKVPVQVVNAIQHQVQMQTMSFIANAIVGGDYEGAEIIPEAHKMLIGDMVLTLSQNRALETAPCKHCNEIRMEHPLDLETGYRYCKDEHQPKLSEGDPTLTPSKNKFHPEPPKIVRPSGADDDGPRIIRPGH